MKQLIALIAFCAPAVCRAEITPADIMAAIEADSSPASAVQPPQTDGATSLPAPARDFFTEQEITEAGQQPTPMAGVAEVLRALNPQPNEVLVDFGCGFDARYLIVACRDFGVLKAVGVEIEPSIADSARRYVEAAGLSDRIEIITGDATEVSVAADVGVAYLYPETLAALRPQIEQLDRFVAYGFAVPGLATQQQGNVFAWQRTTTVPVTRTVREIVRLPRGSYCEVCRGFCSNPMQHRLQTQIVGYRTVPTTQPKPAGRWVTRKVCVNGVCRYVRQFVSY